MGDIYKGYVPTRNKKALIPFKNKSSEDLFTFEQVKNLPEYAGILDDDVVLIDVDDTVQANKLLSVVKGEKWKCRVYETRRGCHFVFKNNEQTIIGNKTHCKLAIGVEADIKIGSKTSYEVLKFAGKERPVIYDTEEYEEVPIYLTPVSTKIDINSSENGSRNSTLFGYILPLQSAGLTSEEAKRCIELINEYILNDPLDNSEISTITREASFAKPTFFNNKGAFLFDKFAAFLKAEHRITKINGQLYSYKDGVYVSGTKNIEAFMIDHIPSLNKAKRTEVLSYLELLANNDTLTSDANLIAFKNGVYNLANDELEDWSPNNVIVNKINYNYNPNAYSEIMDKTLDKLSCNDKEVRSLLEEVIGYCFYTRAELGKAFILIGDKSNGKSTFLDLVKHLLSEDNISALDIKELDERFKTAELSGKLANIGDDIGDEFVPNPAVFKKLVTGNRLNVERKGLDPFEFNNYSKLLFSANTIPRIKDKTGAVQRRLVIIPFEAVFSPHDADYDPYIKYKLQTDECMEYLVQLGLKGLRRVLENQEFSKSSKVERELTEYEETNNPIIAFFKELALEDVENEPTKAVYRKYHEYCIANALQPMSNIEFSKQIKKWFDCDVSVKRVDGETVRLFVKK